jgi:hypothetical protein
MKTGFNYRLRNKKTGLFYAGRSHLSDSKEGKIYSQLRFVKSALSALCWPKNCTDYEIVEFWYEELQTL